MRLNNLEFVAMNNPLRAVIQDRIEAKRFRQLSTLAPGKKVLEIGCGNGVGARLIKKYFLPASINAIDLDKRMVDIAVRKNKDPSIFFSVGDAAKLTFRKPQFDAVFDFGIIHHIPEWRDCLDELRRVLKPGGELILEELSIESFETCIGKAYRKLLDHPYDRMFTRKEFVSYLSKSGFRVEKEEAHNPLGLLRYFVIVARKQVSS
ncbi:MAG: class I SAM-dependent methyltransferase [Nanoarchaeota archaeon]|nr:class I SAM-dependent methyltransferase [Nanoarchaeota archaeon]